MLKGHYSGYWRQQTMVRVLLADMSRTFDRMDCAQLLQHLASMELCHTHLACKHSYITKKTEDDGKWHLTSLVRDDI